MKLDSFERFATLALVASLIGLWVVGRSALSHRLDSPPDYRSVSPATLIIGSEMSVRNANALRDRSERKNSLGGRRIKD